MRRISIAIAFLSMLALLAGCGVSLQDETNSSGETTSLGEDTTSDQEKLPPRPPGLIRIDGATDAQPTEALFDAYEQTEPGISLQISESEESEAFTDFCDGSVDIVASTRPISRREYEACRRGSVQPVQIQLASDAAVLAIRNETNVGVDCLTLGEVQEIFRAGSPIENWSQVDFLSPAANTIAPPVKVTGPEAESTLFEFFSAIVLGTTFPSLASVRGDYSPHPEPRGVRLETIGGNNRRLRLASRSQATGEVLRGQVQSVSDAKQAVRAAEFQVRKGIEDRRPPAARAADRRHLAEAEAKLKRIEARLPDLRARSRAERDAARRLRLARGTLGMFGFTYYEVWEEQLRPMEIDTRPADAEHPNCIFPSTQTISNATYPLARQTLLTVSVQRLHEAEIQALLTFMVRNTTKTATELGLVPLPDERRDQELSWIAGESAPDVIFYSVSPRPTPTESSEAGG